MKAFYRTLLFIAAAAMAFVSCEKEVENPEIENVPKMKTIQVSTGIATRTSLDKNHENIIWEADDKISLFNNIDNENTKLTYSPGGYIEVEVPETTTEIYTHYPYYSDNTNGPKKTSIYISANQKQTTPGALNGYNFPMVAKGTVNENNRAVVSFYPVAGALALNIYHSGLSGEENVKSVTVTPSENTGFIGSQETDITADAITYANPTGKQTSVTVTLTNHLKLSSTAPSDKQKFDGQIYVCLAKQSYKNVKFTIVTDKDTYEITSSATNAFDLENNDFIPVNINLAKATKVVEPTVFTVGQNTNEKIFEIATIFPSVKNGIKFVYDKGAGESTTEPIFYSPFRWYTNGTVTISAGDTPINKVVFTFSGNEYKGSITASKGSYAEGIWTPTDNTTKSVTFSNTDKQARFSKIEVYTDNPGTEEVVSSTPSLSVNDLSLAAESTAELEVNTDYRDGTSRKIVTYSSSNESIATVNADGIVTGVAPGTAKITAKIAKESTDYYVINNVEKECTVTVTSAISYQNVSANDWSYSFTSNPWGKDATTGNVELTSGETAINWGLTAAYGGVSSGLQLGTNNNYGPATLKTNNVITNISSVVVYARANNEKKVTLTVKAGETSLGSVVINASEYAPYIFTSSSTVSGKLSIEFTEATGGYFINQIKINPVSYSITCNTNVNGTISASTTSAFAGDEITLTATPTTGYVLDSWSVKDASNNTIAVTGDSFTMPASNVIVSATFKVASGTTYTVTWNATNNSKGVNNYTSTWSVTSGGFTCDMVNWNNNNNGWDCVKAGSKNDVSIAAISTNKVIKEAIKTVKIAIDGVNASKINSLKLYVSSSNTFTDSDTYPFTVGVGEQSVSISTPAANKYYKIEADCQKGTSNGFITVSKLVFTTE